nr:MAG: coiled-coil domain protein [uncultured archaeon]
MCGENYLTMTELNSKMNEVITKVLNISKRVKALEELLFEADHKIPALSQRIGAVEEQAVLNNDFDNATIEHLEKLRGRVKALEEQNTFKRVGALEEAHGQFAELLAKTRAELHSLEQKEPSTDVPIFLSSDHNLLMRIADYLGESVKEVIEVTTEEAEGLDEEILDVEDLPVIEEISEETLKKLDEVID